MRTKTGTFADLDASAIDLFAWGSLGVNRWGDIKRLSSLGVSPAAFTDPDPDVRVWAVSERDRVLRRPINRLRPSCHASPEHLATHWHS